MSKKKEQFLCGVVEGFYGRPWTTEQRFDLFSHMCDWSMNSYLYAPKDDEKHRAYWRDMYTLEEAAELTQLIKGTTSKGIHFIYAISPGLDITFSSNQEIALLKKKLDQVAALGCTSFAILFDDIDSEMLQVDAKQFPSFAHAQTAITNDVFAHLGNPELFLFCPTEYCASRAEPSVEDSQYLKHIGEHLHPDIDIMWTGPKVISKVISEDSIDELSEVIRRPPVIWDNLHANDYDQRRLFLGPYVGRSVELIPKLRGVLTNPNCEYGANYVPIHTLAQWSYCGRSLSQKSPPIKQSILLEVEGRMGKGLSGMGDYQERDYSSSSFSSTPAAAAWGSSTVGGLPLYDPQKALEASLREWFLEFHVPRKKPEHYKSVKNSDSVSQAFNQTGDKVGGSSSNVAGGGSGSRMECDFPPKGESGGGVSKMDTSQAPPPITIDATAEDAAAMANASTRGSDCCSSLLPPPPDNNNNNNTNNNDDYDNNNDSGGGNPVSSEPFSLEDMHLLVDYFYLPHKHGSRALQILEEFCWLKEKAPGYEVLRGHGYLKGHGGGGGSKELEDEVSSAQEEEEEEEEGRREKERRHRLSPSPSPLPSAASGLSVGTTEGASSYSKGMRSDGETSESLVEDDDMSDGEVAMWSRRAENFHQLCAQVNEMHTRLTGVPNRTLLYDLYQYAWDARETTMLLDSYIAWLEAGGSEINPTHEPHCPRGGITAEMQLLLPRVKGSRKLITQQHPPLRPSPELFVIRPYRNSDKELLYRTCLETGDSGRDATDVFNNYPNLLGDRFVGPYLEFCRELSFVLEDSQGVCGYVLAALDSSRFYQQFRDEWLPKILRLYPTPCPTPSAESGPEVVSNQ